MSKGKKSLTHQKNGLYVPHSGDGINHNYIAAIFGILVAIQIAGYSSLHEDINSINEKIYGMHGDINGMHGDINGLTEDTRDLSNRVSDRNSPAYGGEYFYNNSSNRNITILYPINGSRFNETAPISGTATLYHGDYVYIITKVDNKYKVSMDCNTYPNGQWEGAREYRIPDGYNNESNFYEIFAIITDKVKPLGTCGIKIPRYSARSNSIYIGKNTFSSLSF